MDLVLQDMRPSALKFALVLSLWHPWSHLPGGPVVRTRGCTNKLLAKKNKQALTQLLAVPFISPSISYFMNPVLPRSCSYESCFNTSIFRFPPKRTMFFCCFTVPNDPTLRGKSSESSVGSRCFFFKCQPHGEKYGPQKLHEIFHPKVRRKNTSIKQHL